VSGYILSIFPRFILRIATISRGADILACLSRRLEIKESENGNRKLGFWFWF
jgi:hypothetical protein